MQNDNSEGDSFQSIPNSSLQSLLERLNLIDDLPEDKSVLESKEVRFIEEVVVTHDSGEGSNSCRSSLDFSLTISQEEWDLIDLEIEKTATPSHPGDIPQNLELEPSKVRGTSVVVAQNESAPRPFQSSISRGKYRFSPSTLAFHAHTSCEKMLHLKGNQLWRESQEKKSSQTNNNKGTILSISDANTQRGLRFEEKIQSAISDRIDCEAEGDKDSFFRLVSASEGKTLCQPIFSLDESFYTPKMRQAGIVFGRFIPDFIKILPGTLGQDGKQKKRLYIIDAKSSSHVKISHQIQVTLYAIFIAHLIKVNNLEDLLEIDTYGGVWIPQFRDPRKFSLTFMRPTVERFIYEELPSILLKPLESTIWHIDSPCLQCEFLPICTADAREQRTMSLIPLLSKQSATRIKSYLKTASSHDSEIEDIEDLIKDKETLPQVDKVFLEKTLHLDADGNSPMLTAYHSGALQVLDVRTMDLPRQHFDRLIINFLIDPLTGLPFAYSLDLYKLRNLEPSRSISNATTYSSRETDTPAPELTQFTVDLIDRLHEQLVQISEIQPRPPILSIFFYNQEAHSSFYALLFKIISANVDRGIVWPSLTRQRAMDLLVNIFEDSDFLKLVTSTESVIKLPDILKMTQESRAQTNLTHDKRTFIIVSAVQNLIALPTVGPYSFKDLMTYIIDVESPDIINSNERDDDGYNLNSIYNRWTSGTNQDEIARIIARWAKQQNLIFLTLFRLVNEKHDDLLEVLLAPQASFEMRSRINFQSSILAQLAFFKQWEAITTAEKRRRSRFTLSKSEAIQNQVMFQCKFLGRHLGPLPGADTSSRAPREPGTKPSSEFIGKFEITGKLNPGSINCSTMKTWILTADTPNGSRDRLRFDDINALVRPYGRGSPGIVSVPFVDVESKIVYVSGTYDCMVEALNMVEGSDYILERREYEPTLTTSLTKLFEMNQECRLFVDLMKDPNKWGQQRPCRSDDVFMESITSSARQYDMTFSQEQAFSKVITNQLQVIWGPPGSGKTHFLALAILRFVDILNGLSTKNKGQGPQTIVLSAFTHTAINNLVQRIAMLHETIAPRLGSEHIVKPLVMYRLKDPSMPVLEGAQSVEPADLAKLQSQTESDNVVRIICGTVWQIRRAANPKTGAEYMRNVQMLMIDEGSQLLAADAIHAIECLDPQHGRLIVAGDHLQLGPIIAGEYPSNGEAFDPTGSIMSNLMRRDDNTPVKLRSANSNDAVSDIGPCTSQLQDNFRMNEQLGEFMKCIYGPNYQVRTPNRTLPYSSEFFKSSTPMAIQQVLDPDVSAISVELQLPKDNESPQVVQVKKDSRTAAFVESLFVAGIVEYYLLRVGKYTSTKIFIVVPHHIQRLAILDKFRLSSLKENYPMANIKVDTVDKMQGQQADMVIVCFVFFNETVLTNELTHLYSIGRWIVALSRAHCKTVLLMTPELIIPKIIGAGTASPQVLEKMGGLDVLQWYEEYSKSIGGKLVWPVTQDFLQGIIIED
ncbi:Tripartite DNA replication factor [Entomortierella beljakovae]|nr:Tripartite DNA replication factor [Entomortierella beljakovae]